MKTNKPMGFIRNLIFRYLDDEVSAMSSQLAYSLVLSFFPFLILLMTLIGYSSIKSDDVLAILNNILPYDVIKLIKNTVVEVVSTKSFGLLSFGMITTIWTASGGFNAVIRGLNKAYDEEEHRSYFKVQLVAIICTIALLIIIITALSMVVFGELGARYLLKYLSLSKSFELLIDILRHVIGIIVLIFVFVFVYRFTPCKRVSFKEAFPGAIFATLGWVAVSIGFSFYVNNFGNYSKIYGSIGAIIALMSWLFISSTIILLGGEVNATIFYKKVGKEKPKGKRF